MAESLVSSPRDLGLLAPFRRALPREETIGPEVLFGGGNIWCLSMNWVRQVRQAQLSSMQASSLAPVSQRQGSRQRLHLQPRF